MSEERGVSMRASTRTLVAWGLWAITVGACAGGLVVTLVVTRPLTAAVLADGAAFALVFPSATPPSGWSWACGGRTTRSVGCSPPRGWSGR